MNRVLAHLGTKYPINKSFDFKVSRKKVEDYASFLTV